MTLSPVLANLVEVLRSGSHTLAVAAGGSVRTFTRRGVADLYSLLTEQPELLRGASVADKVTGKGAAALMMLGGVAEMHTGVISESALELLAQSDMSVSYDRKVPHIRNRRGDGMCPVESLCLDCRTAAECLPMITEFIERNTQQKI
ncbi:MAG: DUF1893 domain-containing protein [Muribaculaceae bacterium]|nr:DUF1893 domain-containing protein [Muribaculaceae bacterium]